MSALGIENQEIKDALERIGRTPDGWMLYHFLQRAVLFLPPHGAEESALRENHARRMLAAELMAAMTEGIRVNNAGHDPANRPIIFLTAKPVDTGGDAGFSSRFRRYARVHDAEQLAVEREAGNSGGTRAD